MTDISPLKTHADLQPGSVAPLTPTPYAFVNGVSSLDGAFDEDEESSTIRCICGYSDDDGSTVLCERCNTWQHIVCYYESNEHVPEVHECALCIPRTVDSRAAADRQRLLREYGNVNGERRKRSSTKTQKKKNLKDITQAPVQANGWPSNDKLDALHGSDRKSGSPRDQPPPAKRPKTSHKSSNSIASLNSGANPVLAPPPASSRKRASSTLVNGLSPVKSPSTPNTNGYAVDYFSPEFMQLYRGSEFTPIDVNSYADTRIPNALIEWLTDRDALAAATGGSEPAQIFKRIDGTIDDLEQTAPPLRKEFMEDSETTIQGLHPIWHFLVSQTEIPAGAYIGELKGQIGRREDYCSVSSNRWDALRHPQPFVFFPPFLPLYIDARHEGSVLRYARRSCRPNMSMSIIITEERHYHFCLVARDTIPPNEELTIGWDLDKDILHSLTASWTNGNIKKDGIQAVGGLSRWVAGVLSNFGGCACHLPKADCLLERADSRNGHYAVDSNSRQSKTAKVKKMKKSQVSPLGTGGATNSRAGSEALLRGDQDDDNADMRSVSGSSRSKPTSRDITPMTHVSTDAPVGLGFEISDREKRKIMNLERQFEQMAHDEQNRKKKRVSGGPTLNTPTVTSSVRMISTSITYTTTTAMQIPWYEMSSTDMLAPKKQRQLGHTDHSPSLGLFNSTSRSSGTGPDGHSVRSVSTGRASSNRRANGRVSKDAVPKPKPVYCDASTQTDENGSQTPATPVRRRKAFHLPLRNLLLRSQQERLNREQGLKTATPSVEPEPQPPQQQQQQQQQEQLSSSPPPSAPAPLPSVDQETQMADAPLPTVVSSANDEVDQRGDDETKPSVEETPTKPDPDANDSMDIEMKDTEVKDVEMKDAIVGEQQDDDGNNNDDGDDKNNDTIAGQRHEPDTTVSIAPVGTPPPPSITTVPPEPSEASSPSSSSHPPIQPPAPPWPPSASTPPSSTSMSDPTAAPPTAPPPKPPTLHVELPPAPDFSSTSQTGATPTVAATPLSAIPGGIAQSPSTLGPPPLLSPSVASGTTASPLRKKLSLSDYTSRKAKRNIEAQSAAQGQPSSANNSAAVAGGPVGQPQVTVPAESQQQQQQQQQPSAAPAPSPLRETTSAGNGPAVPPLSLSEPIPPSKAHAPPPLFNGST